MGRDCWGQTIINAVVPFGATYFGFCLVLRHEIKKQALAASNKAKERQAKDARRLQVLGVALLRELRQAMDEFKSPSYRDPKAERLFESRILGQTVQEQLELIKSPEVLGLLVRLRPLLEAYKYQYQICLDNYCLGGRDYAVNKEKERACFTHSVECLGPLKSYGESDTRTLAVKMVSLCPDADGVPEDLKLDCWS